MKIKIKMKTYTKYDGTVYVYRFIINKIIPIIL